jgi:elongation factor P--(R)-beta-lysine ligase
MDRETMRQRARIIGRVRSFFGERGYLEVDTPLLAPRLIPESAIEVFPVRSRGRGGGPDRELYLVPSPELWMKRLLASGSGPLFQICHCFRNVEESSRHHAPEFTMLEWYTPGHTYLESAETTEGLLRSLGRGERVERATMEELFREHAGIELGSLGDADAARRACARLGIELSPEADWEECFNKIFLGLVEPRLGDHRALLVLDYPCAVPTLARRKPGTPWAERWELYLDGVEIANCYTEETDPAALRALAERESAKKAASAFPHPADFGIAELDLPPCSGTALGLDRLVMSCLGAGSIDQVIFFPGFGIL